MNWNEMDASQYNTEVASRLCGLAAMVESCDEPVKIKMSARLKWSESGDEFRSGILPFTEFSDRFASYTTEKIIEILRKGDPQEAGPLIQRLEAMLKR